jgi:hypothetical protein
MDNYLQNLQSKLQQEFNGDVIPIPLKKGEKQPLYGHANKSNDDVWKLCKNKGFGEVLSENADLGLLIRNRAMIVVDFDDKVNFKHYEMFEEAMPEFKETVKASTKKGYHYFFKGTEEIKLSNIVRPFGEEIDIDIITTWDKGTGGIITIYPSANKEWINNIIDTTFQPLPSKFVEFYKDKAVHLKKYENTKEKKPKNDEQEEDYDEKECDFDTLKAVVMGLDPKRSVGFDDWTKVVWAIYNIGHFANVNKNKIARLIHNFSEMGADKYDEDKVDDWILNNCEVRTNGYKMGTLVDFLKQDNRQLYNQLFNKVKTYEEVKKTFELTHFKVIDPPCYCTIKEDGNVRIQSRKDLKESYEHLQHKSTQKSKETERYDCFIDAWFKDPTIRHYEYIDILPPPLVCPPTTFNMWRGFAVESVKVESSGNIEPALKHIDILVNHDEKGKDFFIKHLAHIIQYPGLLNGIALVFKSEQGAGKNILLEFISQIIGEEFYYETADPAKNLWSRFALGRKNRLLINIDETSGKDTIPVSQQLKNHITSKYFNYEKKGIDEIRLRNINRSIFTTNNQTPIKIEEGDRRYVVYQCSDEKKGNKKYFDDLLTYFNEPANQKAFYEYLKSIDISNVDWINDRPITELYKDIQSANTPIQIKFFKWIVENNDNDDKLRYSGEGLFEHLLLFLKKGNYKVETNDYNFKRMIKDYIRLKKADDVVGDASKSFIIKSYSNGRVVYKIAVNDVQSWLVSNKYINDCMIEDEEEL